MQCMETPTPPPPLAAVPDRDGALGGAVITRVLTTAPVPPARTVDMPVAPTAARVAATEVVGSPRRMVGK